MPSPRSSQVQVESLFDSSTSTFSHIVHGGSGSACAVIDPVLGYDPNTGQLDVKPADALLRVIDARRLSVEWILETHIHADHLTAAAYLRDRAGGRIGAGSGVRDAQRSVMARLGLEIGYCNDGRQFDSLFEPGEQLTVGDFQVRALALSGHTPSDVAFIVDERLAFVGDTIFQPDIGTARCDFPGGSAAQLYRSVRQLLTLPGETRLFLCPGP